MLNQVSRRVLAALMAVALLLAAGCVKNPVTGADEFSLMTEQMELAKGKELYPYYTQKSNGLPADDAALQNYVSNVGKGIAKNSHRPGIPWEFNVVNSSEINAYALPGGKVSVTRGLITKLDNEDQLAFVLGHEAGHVAARHSAAQYTRGILVSAAVAGVGIALSDSDYQAVGTMAASVGGALVLAGYSRDQERQADALGVEYMTKAGYNPRQAAQVLRLFQSLQKTEPSAVETLFATHPLSSERVINVTEETEIKYGWASARLEKKAAYEKATARQEHRQVAYKAMDKGDALYHKGNYDEAAAQYQKAADLLPQEGLFKVRLARSQLQLKQFDAAKASALQGVKLSPDLYEARLIMGAALQKDGNYRQALGQHLAAQKLLPTVDNQFMIAVCYDKLGDTRRAKGYYTNVAKQSPRSTLGKVSVERLNQLNLK